MENENIHVLGHFSHVWLFVTPWTVAHHTPLSVGFSRQQSWSGSSRRSFRIRDWTCSSMSPALAGGYNDQHHQQLEPDLFYCLWDTLNIKTHSSISALYRKFFYSSSSIKLHIPQLCYSSSLCPFTQPDIHWAPIINQILIGYVCHCISLIATFFVLYF